MIWMRRQSLLIPLILLAALVIVWMLATRTTRCHDDA